MTIIINTPPASAGGNAGQAGATSSAASEGGGDLFASLLGVQMSAMGGVLQGLGDGGDGKDADDKPASKHGDDADPAQAALALPLLAALQPQQALSADVKAPTQDLLAQQGNAKVDPALLLQVGKQGFNWQANQQKLPDQDASAPQFLPLQQLQQPSQSQQAQALAVPQLTLPQTLNDPNWGKALGEQMLSMVNLKMDKAQIQLNPPQMGPIEVTLKMNGTDQAQVLFTAAVPATREALENNMHKLSSMLSSSGIQLTDSQVSSGNSGRQQQAYQQKRGQQNQGVAEVDGVDALASIKAARGILSIFA